MQNSTRYLAQGHSRGHRSRHVNRRISMKPQFQKYAIPQKLWNILPQGLWLKSENFSISQKIENSDKNSPGILENLQTAFKGAIEKHDLINRNQKKIETATEMTNYVSNMMKDYFTSDNLWKVVSKPKVSLISL